MFNLETREVFNFQKRAVLEWLFSKSKSSISEMMFDHFLKGFFYAA